MIAPLALLALAPVGLPPGDPPAQQVAAPPRVARPALPDDRGLGQPLSISVGLQGLDGKPTSLRRFVGRRAVVLIFAGTECPVGNLYMPSIVALAAKYKDRAVQFVVVNSNASEPLEAVAAHAKEYGLDAASPNLVVVKDPRAELADLALAERTNEAVVIDGTLAVEKIARIRYRGAIDDQYDYTTRKAAPAKTPLADALEDMLANRPVAVPATPVVGCLLERDAPVVRIKVGNTATVRPASEDIQAAYDAREPQPEDLGPVSFHEHVAPILQARCQGCHRPDQVAPLTLMDYQQAKRWSAMIAEVVEARRMPPWHADPRHDALSNDRSLSALERATLLAWVDQGLPEGDKSKAPAPATFPEGWTIGTPDQVIEMPREYVVPAGGVVDYVREFLPDDLIKEDRWVTAAEVRPSDPAVVHHVIVYYIPPGEQRPRFLVAYAPGDLSVRYEPGTAKRLPARSRVFFELHYTPIGQIRRDRTRVGLVYAKPDQKIELEAIVRDVTAEDFARRRIRIPAGDPNFEIKGEMAVRRPMTLIGFMPHMHLRGKDFRYELVAADGTRRTLLSVPAFDYAWQSYYWLKKPIELKPGETIACTAHFDNSAGNPANPDPTAVVSWGDQTFEEMMIGFIEVTQPVDQPKEAPAPRRATSSVAGNVLRMILGGGGGNGNTRRDP